MVNSQRLRIDTCYFCLGKLIHFKTKMPLPIGDRSWYFPKRQLAYLGYLCDRLSYRCLKNVIHQIDSVNEWLLLSVTFMVKRVDFLS